MYRSRDPLEAVARRSGHDALRNSRDAPLTIEQLLTCDVVHIHRDWTPPALAVMQHLHDAGVAIVWDNDDDVLALPRWNPLYQRFGARRRREITTGIAAMVRLADVVTTPSAVLASQYRTLGARDVRVLENFLPARSARARRRRHRGIAIATMANLEHHVDYEQLGIRAALQALLDEHPDLRVLNLGLGLGLPGARCEHIRDAPFEELPAILSRADVGIAPLVDIPWNRARSNVKLKEYAAAGLAWLASPVGPYVGMGEEQGGQLVPDDGWHAALNRLIADSRLRRKLARRATRWARGEGVEAHAGDWESALRDAVDRRRARTRELRSA
jgi:glycosyltransferase involved in cell wall biosynthesis